MLEGDLVHRSDDVMFVVQERELFSLESSKLVSYVGLSFRVAASSCGYETFPTPTNSDPMGCTLCSVPDSETVACR